MTDPTQGGLPGQPPQGAPTPPPGAPTPPTGAPQPGPPLPYPAAGGSDPGRPGSRAWVEQRYGRTAGFGDRILPGIIDSLLGMAAAFIPVILGIVCIVAGMPDTYDCGVYYTRTCEVPGSGSGGLVGLGILLIFLSFLAAIAMAAWNRVWRVTKTGQSIGKKVTGLKVIDAESGKHPQLGPAALREARRGMHMATELGLPLVTIIDTPGADLSPHAEEGALAGEIARSIADMTSLTVPSVSVLLGQGTGGGALAMLPARRVIAASNAWLSPLPPEGASAIVFKDTDHAPLLAARQRVGAHQMQQDGIVDVIVPESPAAHEDPEAFAAAIAAAISEQVESQIS